MERLAAAWEAEGSDYLDPELAALCEATRASCLLPGMEDEGEEAVVRYHGVFADRSRMRRPLPTLPGRPERTAIEITAPASPAVEGAGANDPEAARAAAPAARKNRLPHPGQGPVGCHHPLVGHL
jgi:hypothetical protein